MKGITGKVLLITKNSVQLFSSKLSENTNLKCWVLGPSKMRCPGVKQEISLLSIMVPSIVIICHVCYHHFVLNLLLLLNITLIITYYFSYYYLLLSYLNLIITSLQMAKQNHYHGSISCWPLFQFNATVGLGFKQLCFSLLKAIRLKRKTVTDVQIMYHISLCIIHSHHSAHVSLLGKEHRILKKYIPSALGVI